MAKRSAVKHGQGIEYLEYLISQTSIGLTEEDILTNLYAGPELTFEDKIKFGINELEKVVYNPVLDNHPFSDQNMAEFDLERPELKLVDVLRRPEYFPFTCYNLMSVNGAGPLRLMPFQGAILRELWTRQFPMLIASRGAGKCEKGDTMIITSNGFRRIDSFAKDATPHTKVVHKGLSVYGENGFKDVEYAWSNGFSKTIKLKTRIGFEKECTHNHPLRVVANGEIAWKDTSEIKLGDRIVIDRSTEWFSEPNDLPEDLAYALGLITGDGGYTVRGRISFTTADTDLASNLSVIWEKYFGKGFKKSNSNKYDYNFYSTEVWDKLFSEYGFNSSVCGEKDIPESVWSAPKKSCAAFIRGMFDTDGCVEGNRSITLAAKSPNMVKHIQFLLTRFGIISRTKVRFNKKYNINYHYLTISGPATRIFMKEIGFGLKRKSDKGNNLLNFKQNSNVDTIPDELVHPFIFEMRDKLRSKIGPSSRTGGKNLEFKLLNPHRVKSYEMTYSRLAEILEICKERCGDFVSYKKLEEIYNKNYFYDRVVSLEESECETYDLYIPDGHSFIADGFISHNSFLLALYILLRLTFQPGVRIAVVAKSLRQSMIIWEYCSRIWQNSPLFRDLVGKSKGDIDNGPRRGGNDRCEFRIGESIALFLPLGATGSTIRGVRAQVVIADEFSSIAEEVYSVVVAGFGAVSGDPVGSAENKAREKILKVLGLWSPAMDLDASMNNYGNQSILSGTTSYQFNHFYRYWKNYRDTIMTGGDPKKISELFNGGPIPPGFDWRKYSIIRMPWSKIPHGYMDESTIGRAKQTSSRASFFQEYECCFLLDSDGFFKQSLIESCTIGSPLHDLPCYPSTNNEPVDFTVKMNGNRSLRYVYGIDPAFERDNFCVTIIEVHPDHRRVVYAWTTNKTDHRERRKSEKTEFNFYDFCVQQIRLMFQKFPPAEVVIDAGSGGGSTGLVEAFANKEGLEPGELPIFEVVDPDKPKDTDRMAGHKIIRLFSFAKNALVKEANWGLQADLESRVILFPRINAATYGMAYEEDVEVGRVIVEKNKIYAVTDTLENTLKEIEEMKEELATIIMTPTKNGTEHWDVPGAGELGKKKGYMKKDRYSALLLANWGARNLGSGAVTSIQPVAVGGFVEQMISKKEKTGQMYVIHGMPNAKIPAASGYGRVVRRGV